MSSTDYTQLLASHTRTWLVTGVAGFIGSNLLETLLSHGQRVVGLDNFSTGHRKNLAAVEKLVGASAWKNFTMIEGDITRLDDCMRALDGVDVVLHQAALGSVPRSIAEPLLSHQSNVNGFFNLLLAARDKGIKRIVYAASSATYGDHEALPKTENVIGKPLSPYAVTKHINELYAYTFGMHYGLETLGLRYFNVFGARQDPEGAYAAVIPKWFNSLYAGEDVFINGDGETSRDFCYIDNVVQANILAALSTNPEALNEVYNIAVGQSNTLNTLFNAIRAEVAKRQPKCSNVTPIYREFRAGDVRHSLADISKAQRLLQYAPGVRLHDGLAMAAHYYHQAK